MVTLCIVLIVVYSVKLLFLLKLLFDIVVSWALGISTFDYILESKERKKLKEELAAGKID